MQKNRTKNAKTATSVPEKPLKVSGPNIDYAVGAAGIYKAAKFLGNRSSRFGAIAKKPTFRKDKTADQGCSAVLSFRNVGSVAITSKRLDRLPRNLAAPWIPVAPTSAPNFVRISSVVFRGHGPPFSCFLPYSFAWEALESAVNALESTRNGPTVTSVDSRRARNESSPNQTGTATH